MGLSVADIDPERARVLSRQQHRQEHDTDRQRSALFLAGVATGIAQGISALTQLWLAPTQLQAAPAVGAVADGAQARREGGRPGGHAHHAATCAASIERTPQTAVPVLRRGDGDRASAHRTPGIDRWHGGAAPRCCTRGNHALSRHRRRALGHQHAHGCGGGARLKDGC